MIENLKKIIQKNKDNKFYVLDDKYITYDELFKLASLYSSYLKREGNSPVIIYGHKEMYVVISIISCLFAKRTYVPIGSCTPISRLKEIASLTKSSLIITDYDIDIDDISCMKLEELEKYKNEPLKNNTNNIAYMIFTSGSTGVPKGVPISYENLENFVKWISNLNPLDKYKNVNVLNQASFSFDLSVADLYYSLFNGHTLYPYNDDFNSTDNRLYDLLKQIDVAVMTPTFVRLCMLDDEFNHTNYSKLKCIYFCGEQLEKKIVAKLFERFPEIKIINAYGPTEATSAVSATLITKKMLEDNNNLLPCGDVNNSACNIDIVDNKIILSGKSVFQGYIGNLIGGYFRKDNINFFNTGDIGIISLGKLYCKGREDNQIKYKGYRIELNDIEENINKINGVKESVVIAKKNDENIVKTIKAFVEGENIDSNYIKNELAKLIPEYMMPKVITIVEKLPINNNGKIDRKALMNL